jgi:hypothetical protein
MEKFFTHREVMFVGISVGTAVSGGDLEEQLGLGPHACANVSCPRTPAGLHAHRSAMKSIPAACIDNILLSR